MLKRFLQITVLITISFVTIGEASAVKALESTQILNKLKLIDQYRQQVNDARQTFKTLVNSPGILNDIKSANMDIFQQFMKVRDIWKKAGSLTHAMDDFMDKHAEKNPKHEDGKPVNVAKEREERDKANREMIDGYLKGINMMSRDLENAQKSREKLFSALQATNGQVSAIQALGGLINNTSQVIEQNNEILSGYVTMQAENNLDERAKKAEAEKNMKIALDNAINHEIPNEGFNPGDH